MGIRTHEVSADASDSSATFYVNSRLAPDINNPSSINVLTGHTYPLPNNRSSAVEGNNTQELAGKEESIEASTVWQVRKVKLQPQSQY